MFLCTIFSMLQSSQPPTRTHNPYATQVCILDEQDEDFLSIAQPSPLANPPRFFTQEEHRKLRNQDFNQPNSTHDQPGAMNTPSFPSSDKFKKEISALQNAIIKFSNNQDFETIQVLSQTNQIVFAQVMITILRDTNANQAKPDRPRIYWDILPDYLKQEIFPTLPRHIQDTILKLKIFKDKKNNEKAP